MMEEDINEVRIRGRVGDKIYVSDTRGEPSVFSVKTVRRITTTDGDQLNKFDWHSIYCMSSRFVKKLKYGMRIELFGRVSTTNGKSGIIASEIKIADTDEEWRI